MLVVMEKEYACPYQKKLADGLADVATGRYAKPRLVIWRSRRGIVHEPHQICDEVDASTPM